MARTPIEMLPASEKPTCFIAMPITTHSEEAQRYGGDEAHWEHVMETVFVPAIERAGFRAIRPVAVGTHLIHGQIIKHLSEADMVLCDLSSHNPNVFFELGVRTSLNKPITLVKDEHLKLPFDTSGLNTHLYSSMLRGWEIEAEVARLAQHLKESVESCNGINPMWKHYGLTIAAEEPSEVTSSSDAQIQLMFESVNDIRAELALLNRPALARPYTAEDGLPTWRSRLTQFGLELAQILGVKLRSAHHDAGEGLQLQFEKSNTYAIPSDLFEEMIETARVRGFRITGVEHDETTLIVHLRSADL